VEIDGNFIKVKDLASCLVATTSTGIGYLEVFYISKDMGSLLDNEFKDLFHFFAEFRKL
jgi:hypothetical protein